MTGQIGDTATSKPFAPAGSDDAPELEAVMHLMWDRIEGLEAERRSLGRMIAGGLAAGVLVAVLLAGIFVSYAGPSRSPRDVAVTDASGRVRARLEVDPRSGATMLQLLDQDGHARAILAAEEAGPALNFYDSDGTARLRIGLASKSPILDVIDAQGGHTKRIDLASPPLPVSASPMPRRRPGSSPVVSSDRQSAPRYVDAKGRACASGTLGCRRSDS